MKYFRSSVNIFTGNSTPNPLNQYLFLEKEINIHETNSTWFTFGFRQAGRRSVVWKGRKMLNIVYINYWTIPVKKETIASKNFIILKTTD